MAIHLACAVILLAILFCAGCTSPEEGSPPTTPPSPEGFDGEHTGSITIAVTIPPLRQFVEAVGGERVSVMVMIPPGASPHTYEPTPAQLRALSETDVYVMVGSGIEFETIWMDRVMAINPTMALIDTSEGIALISTGDDEGTIPGTDPHIWTSPVNAARMVTTIEEELSRLYPAFSDDFSQGAESYIAHLDARDTELRTATTGRDVRPVMVYHPAWTYVTREYSIPLIVIEEDGKEPSPAHIKEMIDTAKKEGITTIIVSPEHSTRSAEVIARETGSEIIYISSLEEDYLSMIDRLTDVVLSP